MHMKREGPMTIGRIQWAVRLTGLFFLLLLAVPQALAAQAATGTPIQIEVSLGDVSLNKVPFLVAADAGIYAKNGLSVHQYITPYAADKARRQGVDVPAQYVRESEADDAHISVGGGTPMIVGFTRDVLSTDRVIIATFEGFVRDHIISSQAIRTPADLKGKRLGYSGDDAVTHLAAIAFARQMGWDPQRDISLYIHGNTPAAITSGRIDAFIGSALVQSMASKENLKDLIDLTQYRIPVAGSGLNADRAWLRNNHDAAMRFVKSSIEAVALVKSNKKAFTDAAVKWFNIRDTATQDRMYHDIEGLPRAPYPTVDGIKKTMEIYDYHEMRKHKPEDFYDASFVMELDRGGFIAGLYR
jgi:ABC-type nitrate/sulfonate/bicarbonate transport system substrate-binding protein